MKLGKYKGIKVKAVDLTVKEQELQRSISNMQRKNSVFIHVDERPAKLGDVVVLNYEGYVEGKPFLGGKATHHRMRLGENKFLPGFEAQIVGKTMGDVFEIPVKFPEAYANEQVAGKEALFKTELLFVGIEDIPEFDDEFALDFSSFATADELKESLFISLRAKREAAEEKRIQEELLSRIIEDSEIELSEDVLEELAEEVFEEKQIDLESQGLALEDYLKHSCQTLEDVYEQCWQKAKRSYQETTVLHGIAMKEEFEISEEELEEAVWEIAFYEGIDPRELLETMEEEELTGIKLQLYCDKAMELVRENAVYI